MQLKIDLSTKNILRLISTLIIIGNLAVGYFLGVFFRDNIYYTYFPDKDPGGAEALGRLDDINMARFEALAESYQGKLAPTDFSGTRNIFN